MGVGVAQLHLSVQGARKQALVEFGRLLDEMLSLSPEEIAELLGDECLSQLVGHAWEAAARTASEEKRWVLARITAAALRGETDDAKVDPFPLLLRTVAAVTEPDLHLLALLACAPPHGEQDTTAVPEGSLSAHELEEQWPGARGLVTPMIAVLEREGVIEDRALGNVNYHKPLYGLTDYGRRFLRYLPGDQQGGQNPDVAPNPEVAPG